MPVVHALGFGNGRIPGPAWGQALSFRGSRLYTFPSATPPPSLLNFRLRPEDRPLLENALYRPAPKLIVIT